MKKLTALLLTSLLLIGCGSNKSANLLRTTQPILNIEASVASVIEAKITPDSAWIKNKTEQPLNLAYHLFWYDKNGVTQQQFAISSFLSLLGYEKQVIPLIRPTEQSVNYRLYISEQ
ncbi:DUF1425 domain-containing protein [Pasteurella canis]|uniref:DUF1425 domain-containing protein n=1 Tax=Pasteurella canis TaxID=753 RepID=UPI001D11E590|nr:DUF1425 domain-containing protein [Pasteurella canis]UDW83903.1 DUF1425 domain-containing protein [Pasteurella canis]